MWDSKTNFYYDLSIDEKLCPIKTVAAFWTLIGGVASKEQANFLARQLNNPETFGREYPVPTLAGDEKAYCRYGDYWCGAVWAPTNTMVIRGLERYGYEDLASQIAVKHIKQVAEVYRQTGTIWENYSADTLTYGRLANGKPVARDFVGWSGMAPILYLLEHAIGLKPAAPDNTLVWTVGTDTTIGCRNYHFGTHTVSLLAKTENTSRIFQVTSDGEFTLILKIDGKTIEKKIAKGSSEFVIPKL